MYIIKHQTETDFAFPEIGNHRSSKFGKKIFGSARFLQGRSGCRKQTYFFFWPYDVMTLCSPIHSTLLEMSEVSSDAAILLIRVPQESDAAIVMSAL